MSSMNQRLLRKAAALRFGGSSIRKGARTFKTGVSDMFDLDSSKKGLSGAFDKGIGIAAVGAPAATAAYSVNKTNKSNTNVTADKRRKDNIETGIRAGFVDGSTAALLHRSKNSLGRGPGGLLKRMAIYGGSTAAIGGGLGAAISATNSKRKSKAASK